MKKALKQLLNALDKLVADGHEEVSDTVVREALHGVVYRGLVQLDADERLPHEFGMFTPAGNKRLRAILSKFLDHPGVAGAKKLPTPQARLDAFQDDQVKSDEGNSYDEYFGYNGGTIVPRPLPSAIDKPIKHKQRQFRPGDVVAIPIGHNRYAFGKVYRSPGLGVYAYTGPLPKRLSKWSAIVSCFTVISISRAHLLKCGQSLDTRPSPRSRPRSRRPCTTKT